MKLTDFKALTFDCYGTLIDWETGILNAIRPVLARRGMEVDDRTILETNMTFSPGPWTSSGR